MNLNFSGSTRTTKQHKKGKVEYLTFSMFDEQDIHHAVSTRLGGVSQDYLGEMNLSFTRGDQIESVMMNHHLFAEAAGYEERNTVLSDQVHDVIVRDITEEDAGKGLVTLSDIENTDGLITNVKNIPLMIFTADCVPLLFADPIKGVVAASHAGWKGTVKKIGAITVQKMIKEYGSKVQDIYVAIGPSICQSCYEVSEDVAEQFKEAFAKEKWNEIMIDRNGQEIQKEERKPGKYLLDLWRANSIILEEMGIQKDHITTTDLCTCCNPDYLFSHRASHGKRGNISSVIWL